MKLVKDRSHLSLWVKALGGHRIAEGALYPLGYGVAYRENGAYRAIVMPIPLNIIVGLLRRTYWWLVYPWRRGLGSEPQDP